MATATTRTARGFKVLCPMCSDPDATVRIDLNDLRSIECGSCGESFSAADAAAKAAEQLERWRSVQRWVEMAGAAMAEAEAPCRELGY